jgi:hypothetical protein
VRTRHDKVRINAGFTKHYIAMGVHWTRELTWWGPGAIWVINIIPIPFFKIQITIPHIESCSSR